MRVLLMPNYRRTATTAASRAQQVLYELTQPGSRFQAKLAAQQRPVARELAHGLRLVALGEVHLDEDGTGTFPQRLGPDGRTSSPSGFAPSASGDEAPGERFQGVQA